MDRAKMMVVAASAVLALAASSAASAHSARPASTTPVTHQSVTTGAGRQQRSGVGGHLASAGDRSGVVASRPASAFAEMALEARPGSFIERPPAPPVVPATAAAPDTASGWGCQAALAYLAAHAAPGFSFACPGYAFGRQAMTCMNDPPYCAAGEDVIVIADPCPAAYMNEASNSRVFSGLSDAPIDPYGYCAS